MKYHALFAIFEKWQNLKLSSAEIIGGALRVKYLNPNSLKHGKKQVINP